MGKRILSRRKGKGGIFSSPSHRHMGDVRYPNVEKARGRVIDISHAPGRTVPLCTVEFESNDKKIKSLYIPPHGMKIGDEVQLGTGAEIMPGNILPLSEIPEGTGIYNIESQPGDGGKFVKSAGTSALLVSRGRMATVQLPSGQARNFDVNCRATVGRICGSGRKTKPFYKAGQKYHAWRSTAKSFPVVRGVAMNPVSHPHGGGSHQHVGRPSTVSHHAWPGRKVGRMSPKRRREK